MSDNQALPCIVVVGAGISGCSVAYKLAERGLYVVLVEKGHTLGGKVRFYGCKAVERCQNCGVCLIGNIWDKVSNHHRIHILTNSEIDDIYGEVKNYTVLIRSRQQDKQGTQGIQITQGVQNPPGVHRLENVSHIVVSTGFESSLHRRFAHLHISGTKGIITGTQLEELTFNRTRSGLFDVPPGGVAFIQCPGLRDSNESGLYCSKVCCAYSTRIARMIRHYYPECEIVFFYMELQNVESGDFFAGLRKLDMEFIKCRPVKITGGAPAVVEYEGADGERIKRGFDIVVLSDGIHASEGNDKLAEICRLCQDRDGFLSAADHDCGIFVTGCARLPMKIDETCADALTVANTILARYTRNNRKA